MPQPLTPGMRRYALDLAAFVAGALFPLSLSPFGWWPLSIVSLAIQAWTLEGATVGRGMFRAFLFSAGMYGVGVSWVYVSIHEHGGASTLLAGFLVLLFVVGLSLLGVVRAFLYLRFVRPLRFGLLLGFPALWYLGEWALTFLLTGFPWLFAGYGQLMSPLSGFVPVVGVLGTSFLVALLGTLLLQAVVSAPGRPGALATAAAIFLSGWALGQVNFVRPTGELMLVSAVQGNISQDVKWNRDMVGPIIDTYLSLTNAEWGRDLIVWPEAALTLFRDNARGLLAELDAQGKTTDTTLVLGVPDRNSEGQFLNTAIAVGNGSGQYIKRRLVPFGEYVPMESTLRGVIGLFDLPMSHNSAGPDKQPGLSAGGRRVSLSICYEVVYPTLVRESVDNPDLLVTISNDSWFGDSIGPWQHLQMAQARALENGRYMVRATSNGVTAVIDEKGRVQNQLPQFRAAVLRGEVALFTGVTPYTRYGDWPLLLLVMAGLMILLGYRLLHVSREPIG